MRPPARLVLMSEQTALAAALKPADLGERGEALWVAMGGDSTTDGARAVVLAEACRLADTLEQFDKLLSGDVEMWASIKVPEREGDIQLQINSVVAERRQTVTVLRLTIAQLTNVGAAGSSSSDGGTKEARTVDDLAAKRDARRAGAAGT
ncbi:hypothetical protein CH267_00915 [Rhodococcus sp. 06-621-2]|nr:hypothetical protein CH267_00915 [Rhodococcus sp. 06-621-2]